MQENITVVGTVGSDPLRRTTNGGITLAKFRLASTRRRRDAKTGEWYDDGTTWYTVSAFRELGEHVLASFRKGQRVIVTGSFRVREWESGDKHGKEAEIEADALGHDLRWATTTYQPAGPGTNGRAETPPENSADAPSANEPWPTVAVPGTSGDWGAPGGVEPSAAPAEPQRELADVPF